MKALLLEYRGRRGRPFHTLRARNAFGLLLGRMQKGRP